VIFVTFVVFVVPVFVVPVFVVPVFVVVVVPARAKLYTRRGF